MYDDLSGLALQCHICGSPLEPNSAFCPFCGSAVTKQAPAPAQEPAPEVPVTDPFATPANPMADFTGAPVQTEEPKKEKPDRGPRHEPGPAARVFLRIGTVLLSILLSLSLILTVLCIDMQRLTDEETIERVLDTILREEPSEQLMVLAKGGADDDSATAQLQAKLVDMIYDSLKEEDTENKITATKEQISEFLSRSDSANFLSNKLTGLVNDLINGTDDTHIRSSDVIKLLDRNQELAEEVFGKDVNEKMKEDIRTFMDKNDIDRLIHKEIFPQIREASLGGILSVSAMLDMAQSLSSPVMVILLIILDLVLIGLLLLTNWMRISATMRCVGACLSGVGALFATPTLIIQLGILPLAEGLNILLQLLVSVVALTHYIPLGLGIFLVIASVIVRVFESRAEKKRASS